MASSKDLEIPLKENRDKFYRFLEILPGLVSATFLLLPLFLAFVNPTLAAVFVIIYMTGWLTKAAIMSVRVMQGYSRMSRFTNMDWEQMNKEVAQPKKALSRLSGVNYLNKADSFHKTRLTDVMSIPKEDRVYPEDIVHVVVFPIYNEPLDITRPSIQAVVDSNYDAKNIWFYIAYEGRAGEQIEEVARQLQSEFKDEFGIFEIVKHPEGLENEIKGKGSNINYAVKGLEDDLASEDINFRNVVVTTLDADNRPHKWYFACLTYFYCTSLDRIGISYQPITLYTNNIWDAPAPVRVVALGNSFYQVINSARPHLLRNFSAHAQGLESLIKTNYWSGRTVVEEGHQYWRSYLALNGDYETVPLYVPIHQDAVLSNNFKQTMWAQFVQQRRWAYGASDVAYFGTKWWQYRKNLPFLQTFFKFFRLLDSHVGRATAPLILALGAWGPYIVNSLVVGTDSITVLQLPRYSQYLRFAALAGIPISIYLGFKMLPQIPERYKKSRNIFMLLQWAWLPFVSVIFGSIAAINAQARLFFAKYLETFEVTDKFTKS